MEDYSRYYVLVNWTTPGIVRLIKKSGSEVIVQHPPNVICIFATEAQKKYLEDHNLVVSKHPYP